jgi:hypothetical protein
VALELVLPLATALVSAALWTALLLLVSTPLILLVPALLATARATLWLPSSTALLSLGATLLALVPLAARVLVVLAAGVGVLAAAALLAAALLALELVLLAALSVSLVTLLVATPSTALLLVAVVLSASTLVLVVLWHRLSWESSMLARCEMRSSETHV